MLRQLEWKPFSTNSKEIRLNSIDEPSFSQKISLAEINYDMGDHELLAIRMALEE